MNKTTVESLQNSLITLLKRNKYSAAVDELKKMYKLKSITIKSGGIVVNFKESK